MLHAIENKAQEYYSDYLNSESFSYCSCFVQYTDAHCIVANKRITWRQWKLLSADLLSGDVYFANLGKKFEKRLKTKNVSTAGVDFIKVGRTV